MRWNDQHAIGDGVFGAHRGSPTSSLNSPKFMLVAVAALLMNLHGLCWADDLGERGPTESASLKVEMEGALDASQGSFQFVKSSDLIRLYIETFPFSRRSDVYLKDLQETKSQLLNFGLESLAQNGLESRETAFYLGSHCYLFPNSDQSIEYYNRIARSAGYVGLPYLEVELLARVLAASKDSPGYAAVRSLALKAEENGRSLIALNGLNHFQSGEYDIDGFGNLNLGPSLLLSGDIYRKTGLYERAISKYSEAIRWCGDTRLKWAARRADIGVPEITNEDGILFFTEGDHTTAVVLMSEEGMLRIQEARISKGGAIPEMLSFELATVERNANILIGRSLIEDARSKKRSTSTAGFAGNLYEKAVIHFTTLLEPMSLSDPSSMPYRLELVRASIELARYKNGLVHGGNLGGMVDYTRCISAAESYMRMVPKPNRAQGENPLDVGYMETKASSHANEVAHILVESYFEIGHEAAALEAFVNYFMMGEYRDRWTLFAMLDAANFHVKNRDYFRALPLLTAVNKLGGEFGVRDLAFVAGLMKGLCIRHLNPDRGGGEELWGTRE